MNQLHMCRSGGLLSAMLLGLLSSGTLGYAASCIVAPTMSSPALDPALRQTVVVTDPSVLNDPGKILHSGGRWETSSRQPLAWWTAKLSGLLYYKLGPQLPGREPHKSRQSSHIAFNSAASGSRSRSNCFAGQRKC